MLYPASGTIRPLKKSILIHCSSAQNASNISNIFHLKILPMIIYILCKINEVFCSTCIGAKCANKSSMKYDMCVYE